MAEVDERDWWHPRNWTAEGVKETISAVFTVVIFVVALKTSTRFPA